MATALLRSEIDRFLHDPTPEVLCIRGRWGVGKTYAWLEYLGEAQTAGKIKFNQYAYVSLFGLNSLNDLRYSIFESTVAVARYLDGPDIETLGSLLSRGMDWGRKARPFLDTLSSFVGRKDAGEALARASFLLVRNQLICLDDLERAGDGLKQRDILGLVSFLKEQRKCKIVLLLNDEEMPASERVEFSRQLEKVVDVTLTFDPSPEEAAAIALDSQDPTGAMISSLTIKLGIVNIRVLKKIERLAKLLAHILEPCGKEVVHQAIVTVVLGVWASLQPDLAPSLSFLRTYNGLSLSITATEDKLEPDHARWHSLLQAYGYGNTDELDELIFDGVVRGSFDTTKVIYSGQAMQEVYAARSHDNTFAKAWSRFHGDIAADDDCILNDLHRGALENLSDISPVNLNSTVKLLRNFSRSIQADEVIARYVETHRGNKGILDLSNNHFLIGEEADPSLARKFNESLATIEDDRKPREVLLKLSSHRGWNVDDVNLLSKLTADDFVSIFESINGPNLMPCIEVTQMIGKQPGEAAAKVKAAAGEALFRIAARSPLRAFRLRQYISVTIKSDPNTSK